MFLSRLVTAFPTARTTLVRISDFRRDVLPRAVVFCDRCGGETGWKRGLLLSVWKLDEEKVEFPDDPDETLDRSVLRRFTRVATIQLTGRERRMSTAVEKIPVEFHNLFCVLGNPLHKGGTAGHLYVSSSSRGDIALLDITKSTQVCRGKASSSVYGLLGYSAEHNVIVSGADIATTPGEIHDAKTLQRIGGMSVNSPIVSAAMLTEHSFVLGGSKGSMAIGDLRKLPRPFCQFEALTSSKVAVWSLARTGDRSFASAQGDVMHWVISSGSNVPKKQWVHGTNNTGSGLSYLGPNPLIDPEGISSRFVLEQLVERTAFLLGSLEGGKNVVCPAVEVRCRSKKMAVASMALLLVQE